MLSQHNCIILHFGVMEGVVWEQGVGGVGGSILKLHSLWPECRNTCPWMMNYRESPFAIWQLHALLSTIVFLSVSIAGIKV